MPNGDGLTDREAAIDAIIRFVTALDDGDSELLALAITDDRIMDLTPFNKAGFDLGSFNGK